MTCHAYARVAIMNEIYTSCRKELVPAANSRPTANAYCDGQRSDGSTGAQGDRSATAVHRTP